MANLNFNVRATREWDAIIGNEMPKHAVRAALAYQGDAPGVFVAGPAGSGKSTTIEIGCAASFCMARIGSNPCGRCASCQVFVPGHDIAGLFSYFTFWNGGEEAVHYMPINCRNITAKRLHEQLEGMRYTRGGGLRIIHLEEAASLKRLQCDESLTDIMDDVDFQGVRWFASAVSDHELDAQFRSRWPIKVTTSPGNRQEVASYLGTFCQKHQLRVTADTIQAIARRSWGLMRPALGLVSQVILLGGELTMEMVHNYPFPREDPWHGDFFAR